MARPVNPKTWVTATCKQCGKSFQMKCYKPKLYCDKRCANSDPEIKLKVRLGQISTFNEKYGGHPMKLDKTKSILKKSLQKKYGVDYYSQHSDFVDKIEKTKLERYGDEHYSNVDMMRSTCMKKYGVDNYSKTDEYKSGYKSKCMLLHGKNHYSQTDGFKDAHKRNMFEKFMNSDRFKNFEPKFTFDEYYGVTVPFNQKYKFMCRRCLTQEDYFIDDGKWPKCKVCDISDMSSFQESVYSFLKNELLCKVEVDNRVVIYPKEIDLFLPDKKIAIECNGLYWHSEVTGKKNKMYHLHKTLRCITNGVSLIHIFENDWYEKTDIIKSILRATTGAPMNTVGARKCTVKELTPTECKSFLNVNHLQGNDRSSIKYGLFYKSELVSVMTFCKSRFDKKLEWELSRFCNKLNHKVHGGADKLFKHFISSISPTNVVSYSDRKLFSGKLYLNLGFQFIDNSSPGYSYILDNYKTTKNRMGFQKHKLRKLLPLFDDTISEWENMKQNNFDRVWDCGNSKWVYTNHIIQPKTII